jgi:hypothetical protein
MSASGLAREQISQVRGFADQRPREGKKPDDSANRRISLIVEYFEKHEPAEDKPSAATVPANSSEGESQEHK